MQTRVVATLAVILLLPLAWSHADEPSGASNGLNLWQPVWEFDTHG